MGQTMQDMYLVSNCKTVFVSYCQIIHLVLWLYSFIVSESYRSRGSFPYCEDLLSQVHFSCSWMEIKPLALISSSAF